SLPAGVSCRPLGWILLAGPITPLSVESCASAYAPPPTATTTAANPASRLTACILRPLGIPAANAAGHDLRSDAGRAAASRSGTRGGSASDRLRGRDRRPRRRQGRRGQGAVHLLAPG